jgi:glycosyltransferase involved in cell wall biosynthesis
MFYGLPEDVTTNRHLVDRALLDELTTRYQRFERIFLWLSRVDFRDRSSPMYKGTDKFIRAAAQVVADGANVRVVIGAHGHDSEAARKLVGDLGIGDHVDWVSHLPFRELITYLSIPNAVVFDELTHLNVVSSGLSREALSVGAVVVRSHSAILTNAGYGSSDCPVRHAVTQADAYENMKLVLSWTSEQLENEKTRSIHWAERYLSPDSRIGALVSILSEAMYCHAVAGQRKTQ